MKLPKPEHAGTNPMTIDRADPRYDEGRSPRRELGALDVALDANDIQEIESGFTKITLQGARSSEAVLKLIDDGSKLGSSSNGGHGVSPPREH